MTSKRKAKAKSTAEKRMPAEEDVLARFSESQIAKAVGGQLLIGREIIYTTALPAIYGAQQSIKVLAYAGSGPKSPSWFHD